MPESETHHGLKVSDRLKAIDPKGYLKKPSYYKPFIFVSK